MDKYEEAARIIHSEYDSSDISGIAGYLRAAFQPVPASEKTGEWDSLSKKDMWDTIQEIRTFLDSDGTQTILQDIISYAENLSEKPVAPDVCEWEQRVEILDYYRTTCGIVWDLKYQNINSHKYCPNCGKEIKIKE